MSTTLIYVEVLSIGAEVVIWILLLCINLTKNSEIFQWMIDMMSQIGSSLIVIVLIYVLGCIFDRAADLAFRPIDRKIRRQAGLEISCILVEQNEHQANFLEYTRMRMRILRSSAINLFIIGAMTIWYLIYNNYPLTVVLIICAAFILFSTFSIIGAMDNMKSYYNKIIRILADNKK